MSFDVFPDIYRYERISLLSDDNLKIKIKRMKKIKKPQIVKMNLTLSREFYQVLQQQAQSDYMKVATWTKQFLMKNLNENKLDSNSLNNDENGIEN